MKPLGLRLPPPALPGGGHGGGREPYARIGTQGPNFCFAGHTDVVPPGDAKLWRHDPFGAVIENGTLYGRGAVDMKSAVACSPRPRRGSSRAGKPYGSISLLITGDEEGPTNVNGTQADAGVAEGTGRDASSHCIVGEPTATAASGDVLKIGGAAR